jgi:hypothetical protein
MQDVLVVDPRPEWADRLRVVETAPPRVVVYRTDGEGVDLVTAQAPLAIVRKSDGSTEVHGDATVVDNLDESAQMFVAAWRLPRGTKSARPGEGVSWDHPDFEPPDRPPQ